MTAERVVTINGVDAALEDLDRLRQVFTVYVAKVKAHEPGCVSMRLLEDTEHPGKVIAVTEFADDRAYQDHLASAHVAELRQQLKPLMKAHHKNVYRYFVAE